VYNWSACAASTHSQPRHYMDVSGQILPQYPLNSGLDGSRNQSVGFGEENKYFPAVNGTLHRPASGLLSVPK
jgi:hypothetical protein